MEYDRLTWWTEQPLVDWFKLNFGSLGFDKSVHEDSSEYRTMREIMHLGNTTPDFLCQAGNEWFRVEIEKTAYCYSSHKERYADIVICYVNDSQSPIYRGAKIISLQELGRLSEITAFDPLTEAMHVFERIRAMHSIEKMAESKT